MKSFSTIIGTAIPEALKVLSIPSDDTIRETGMLLEMKFGPQLSDYLRNFGAISFGTVEFNGITEAKKNNSSLVRNTVYLRDAFPGKLTGMVLLEDRGDGDYILCDTGDHIWHFTPEVSTDLVDSGMDLIDYTIRRHKETREIENPK